MIYTWSRDFHHGGFLQNGRQKVAIQYCKYMLNTINMVRFVIHLCSIRVIFSNTVSYAMMVNKYYIYGIHNTFY